MSKKNNSTKNILKKILNIVAFITLLSITIFASLIMGRKSFKENTEALLNQIATTKLLQFESSLNNQLVLVEQMTKSPAIKAFLINPADKNIRKTAMDEFLSYKHTFPSDTVFWVSDVEKDYWYNMKFSNHVYPEKEEYYWYNMTLYETEKYNFNINYNADINVTSIWINAPVRNDNHTPIGMVGTGIELDGYVKSLFEGLDSEIAMYLYDSKGKIIGAQDQSFIQNESFIKDIYNDINEAEFTCGEQKTFSLANRESIIIPIKKVNLNLIISKNYTLTEKISTSSTPFLIILVVIIFTIMILFGTGLIGNLKLLEKAVNALSSGNADLTQRIKMKKGKTAQFLFPLANGCNNFIIKLQEIIFEIKNSKEELSKSGDDMAYSTQDATAAISQIIANIKSIHNQILIQNKNVNDTSDSINEIMKNIDALEALTEVQAQKVSSASTSVEEMIKSIEKIDKSVDLMVSKFEYLLETSAIGANVQQDVNEQIQHILSQSEMLQEANQIISSIAEQTNLLAMNAAIESAHAGEAGKGFSVVADEIRKLSETSTDQSNAIGNQLTGIQESISQVVVASEKSSDAFRDVSDQIKETDKIVNMIKITMEEQTNSSKSINEALISMNESSSKVYDSSHAIAEKGGFILKETKSLGEITAVMTESMNEMGIGAEKINETSMALDNISKKVQSVIDNISSQIDQFKV